MADSLTTQPMKSGNRHLLKFVTLDVLLVRCHTEEKGKEEKRYEY